MRASIISAVVGLAVTSVSANTATINNLCSFPVYMWAVDVDRVPGSPTVIQPGGSYSEPYHKPKTGGVSLKLSKTKDCVKITQFEYTQQSYGQDFIWYDGSNVDCTGTDCPFQPYGIYMYTSKDSCPTRTCTPGAPQCDGFYTLWNDDINSLACDATADIFMNLCATGPGGKAAPAASVAAPAAYAAPAASSAAASAASSAPASYAASAKVVNEAPTTTLVKVVVQPKHSHYAHRRHAHI
ncbi:hypothetical protein EJ06DRAFT_275611 [Trichodelitschia bisporula]|uniref:Uncharacterized protein n=1 Tax=Trichodelitschia bisporula TaxID=703511 RepID=A0A6G1I5I5_9PEZI|nr:hypothetical protein EJ06DRAFT_275611 [Trichodelitschia bisporula]